MDVRHITDTFSVSPQIDEIDLAPLRARGFRSIVCNRPDGEEQGQPNFAQLQATAERLGLEARHIPITGAPVAPGDIAAFGAALSEMPKPILAYCRTGTRSAILWSLVQAGDLPMQDILTLTHAAGYNVAEAIYASLPEQFAADDAPPARTGTGR